MPILAAVMALAASAFAAGAEITLSLKEGELRWN